MQHTVIGTNSQCIVAQMTLGDELCADLRTMILLTDGIAMESVANAGMRVSDLPVLNSPVEMTLVRCITAMGVVTFAAPYMGETRTLDLRGSGWLCARDSFLFCSRDVQAHIGFVHPVDHGYFADGGFVLYRLSGFGEAHIHCGGTVIEYDLTAGQRVSVDAGCVAAIQNTVQCTAEAFDGSGDTPIGVPTLFLLTLTGPGKIYLATIPPSRIAQAIVPRRDSIARPGAPTRGSLGNLVREL